VTCNQGEITPQDALCILNAYLNHETPPMQCCPDEYISEVDNSSSRIQLRKSIPKGVSNHMFSVEIYGRDLEKLSAFGFDIGYPYQMMSFQSIKRGDLTSTWQFIDAHENIPGVLTIGGFESDPDDTGKNGVIIELLFKTINSDVNTGDIWLFNLRDDVQTSLISNAKVSVSNSSIIGGTTIPTEYRLGQNYPNPFNPETEIRYDIPEQTNVSIRIFNSMGRTIRTIVNKNQQAGSYIIRWDGKDEMGIPVSSGIYFYQMTTNQYNQIMKMILIK